jgi:hypothetical protein
MASAIPRSACSRPPASSATSPSSPPPASPTPSSPPPPAAPPRFPEFSPPHPGGSGHPQRHLLHRLRRRHRGAHLLQLRRSQLRNQRHHRQLGSLQRLQQQSQSLPASQWLYDPCLNGANSAVAGATQTNTNYYRPYPGFGAITTGVSIGASNYNALQTGFVYRLTDLQLNAAYTFSKALGNQNQTNTGNQAYGFDSNIGFQNPRNPRGDYGRPNYDRPHVFTSAYVYQLPFFRHSNHLLAREILSGFGTSGLITAQSGFAQTVGLSSTYAGLANRPNQIAPLVRNSGSGKRALGQPGLYSFASFAPPSFGTFGNSEPGVLRGPKEVSFAAAVNKDFPITERARIQIRAEAFNVFNHPNINSINSTYYLSTATDTSSFGNATSAGDMRQMEFSARVTF